MFRLWQLKWRRYWKGRFFDKKFKELKEKNAKGGEVALLNHEEYLFTTDIENAIDDVIGRRLLDRARYLDVETPPLDDATMWVNDAEEGRWWLSSKGRSLVRKAIDGEKARRFEVRTIWVTKIILPLAGVLVGIIGALIGLVAALRK